MATNYSRYASQANGGNGGGDVFPPGEEEPNNNNHQQQYNNNNNNFSSAASSTSSYNNNNNNSDARQAALDRQRDMAMQRAKMRTGAGGVMATDSSDPISALSASSRTFSRAAPSTSAPRGEDFNNNNNNDNNGNGYYDSNSNNNSSSTMANTAGTANRSYASNVSGGVDGGGIVVGGSNSSNSNSTSGNAFMSNESSSGSGGSLIAALRQRERRTLGAADSDSNEYSAAATAAELASRGIATSYDPTVNNKGGATTSSSSSAAAADMQHGAGRAAEDEDAPIAPMTFPAPGVAGAKGSGGGGADMAASSSPMKTGDASLLVFSDMRKFLVSPTPKAAGVVQCYIEREKQGFNRMYPVYSLFTVDGDRFLLASKKRTNNKTSNYLVTMDKRDLARESPSYLGKVRANYWGTEFTVYDDGASPDPKAAPSPTSPLRQELGIINYASNVLGSRGPRKMKVAVPKVLNDGRRITFQPDHEEDSMMAKFKAGYIQDMQLLINKPPKWNDQVGAYVLNFNGRVTQASVKNFQLVSPDDHETVILQFGRTSKDTFTMDYAWPLSPLQAFSICMSSFDYKLACE